MFVLKNAWAALMRHKWRTVLTVIVALAVSFGSILALCIEQAYNKATVSDYQAQTPTVAFRLTDQALAKRNGADSSWTDNYLTTDQYSTYLSFLNQQDPNQSAASSLPQVTASTLGISMPTRQSDSIKAIAGKADQPADKTGGELTLQGFYTADAAAANEAGKFTLISGKDLDYQGSDTKGALVSQELADKNKLKLGSSFKLGDPEDSSKTYDFTVKGIYRYKDPAGKGLGADAALAKDNRQNAIYVTWPAFTSNINPERTDAKGWSKPKIDFLFTLASPGDFDKFVKGVKQEKLPAKYHVVSPSLEAYEASISPIKSLFAKSKPAALAMWALGGALLLALVAAGVLNRREEIGNALVIGVSKGRLGWQFILETLLPTLLGLALGTLAGSFGAKPLGTALASGYATAMTGGTIWKVLLWGLAASLVLALIAMLPVAFTPTGSIFANREIQEDAR
ncbi:multidrug ABC transporter substrate-binding protein [Bifidobacterium aemilianum]|uniref:Multidrug ABC transporter substrate-binding protein n=1 Tax=Bifidobacterium aemilianum TaxID=2493120 RepID=A0A366KB61_9BIFI|nr:FtsX-like permease family protein [Bifidobacterium aemilianum]RBP97901.1 multidrug ABC transporter substrate-binding protein [Bifidobacterium aemilianum]